ncbi:MAG: helix-turn-helix transcriptional regulator [Parasphingorhabdus sp.]|uniref:helix-turn-helix domain-containing protein n=1 Tax=Parasphingorhabdus sp. TaxID=2709688 RepID=UPI00329161F6
MSDRNVNSQVEKLTEAQKQCLRLVADLMSSKQIARSLQISHHTVDQRLKRAQSILNVSSRAEAARLLISYEAEAKKLDSDIYQTLVYQSSDLPQYRYARKEGASADERSPSVDSGETELRESQAFVFNRPARASKWSTLFSALFEVDRENQLSISARLGLMLLIMMTGLVAFALLVSVAEGLSRIA